jgi:outer membrane protein, heavy metal efflux system
MLESLFHYAENFFNNAKSFHYSEKVSTGGPCAPVQYISAKPRINEGMMKKIWLTSLALVLAAAVSAQTLDDYLRIARANSPGIRAKEVEYQAARKQLPQARALPEPTVDAAVFIRPMMLPMGNQLGSISAMQMFPWPGTLAAREEAAAQQAEVKREAVRVAENQLAFKVKSAWYPLLELEEQIRIQKELLRVLETDQELAVFKFGQGQAPMADAIRADIMIDETTTAIALLELKRKPLAVAFNRLLNRDDDTPVPITEALPEALAYQAITADSLIARHPELRVFDQQIQAAAAEQAAAEFLRKPMIGAGLQYMPLVRRRTADIHEIPPNTGRDMLMPMFTVTLPVWKKKNDAAVEERRLMQTAYADMKLEKQNELAANYALAAYELESNARRAELLDLQMAKTQQAIDLLLAAYRNAGQEFGEVLRLQQQLFRYRLEKAAALAGFQLALAQMEYWSGKSLD